MWGGGGNTRNSGVAGSIPGTAMVTEALAAIRGIGETGAGEAVLLLGDARYAPLPEKPPVTWPPRGLGCKLKEVIKVVCRNPKTGAKPAGKTVSDHVSVTEVMSAMRTAGYKMVIGEPVGKGRNVNFPIVFYNGVGVGVDSVQGHGLGPAQDDSVCQRAA